MATDVLTSPSGSGGALPTTLQHDDLLAESRGVTPRVVALCLALAVLFGCVIPIIDYKLLNTFLGGTHMPPGAIGVLLVLLLVVNLLLVFAARSRRCFGLASI